MSKNLSLYLDLMRFVAALAVVLTHAHNQFFPELGFAASNGGEAVACFFVLSGFVIAFVVDKKEGTLSEYALSRFLRIFPVALLAILLTPIFDKIGILYAPQNYYGEHFYRDDYSATTIARLLVFVNEIWNSHYVYGSSEPYWSLGFEVPYYVIFAALCFLSGRARILTVAFLIALYGPKIILYMPIWLMGVATYLLVKNRNFASILNIGTASLGFFMSGIIYILVKLSLAAKYSMFHFDSPSQICETWLYFHLIGFSIALNIICFDVLFKDYPVHISKFSTVIRWLAGGSFTLYLVHQPLLVLLKSVFELERAAVAVKLLGLVGCILLSYACAELAERRKPFLKRAFTAAATKLKGAA